jgi:type IV pilus assembly protein PilA
MARWLLVAKTQMTGNETKTFAGPVKGRTLSRAALRRLARRGFTLVELAVVVAIVGVLSVIAVVGYRKLTLSAKVTEARNMVSAIRIAQEDYKLERGVYADLGDTNHCPSSGLTVPAVKAAWTPACNSGKAAWSLLPVHSDGPVQFGYATVATGSPPTYGFVNMAAAVTTKPWYVIHAQADLAENGGLNTELVGTSWSSTIFSQNEGE